MESFPIESLRGTELIEVELLPLILISAIDSL